MNGNPNGLAQRLQEPRRALMVIGAFALVVIWTVLLAAPDRPGADSPEAGYTNALRVHSAQVISTIDLVLDSTGRAEISSVASGLTEARDAHAELAGRADGLLDGWGIEAVDLDSNPVSWMGHVLPGAIPGTIDEEHLSAIESSARTATDGLAALVGSTDGSTLMGRAVVDLSGDEDVVSLATSDLDIDRILRDLAQEGRIEAGLSPVAQISAMTTDPGELDHGGNPVDSIGSVVEDAVRLAPYLIAIALLVTGLWPASERAASRGQLGAGVASVATGFLHFGLIGIHYEEAPISGVFFALVAVAQVGLGVALLIGPNGDALRAAAWTSAGVIMVFATFRVISPPGLVGTATVDLTGVVTVALQLVVVMLWVISTPAFSSAVRR